MKTSGLIMITLCLNTAAVMILTTRTEAALDTGVKVGGEIRVRAESVTNDTKDTEDQGHLLQRTRVHLDAGISETTEAYIQLQDSRQWGSDGTSGVPGAGTGTGTEDEAVDIKQAYFKFDDLLGRPISLRVGRQAMAYGEHRLIGNFEWSNNARSFDAIKLMYNTEAFGVDLWTAKTLETVVRGGASGGGDNTKDDDMDFNGLYAAIKVIPNNAMDLYLLQDRNAATDRDVLTYGARLSGKVTNLDYTGEVAVQGGDDADGADTGTSPDDMNAMAYAIRAGYTVPPAMGLRVGAEYAYGSGDDNPTDGKTKAFSNLYPTNHPLYGFTDDIGWSNIKALSFNVSAKPIGSLWVGAEYWIYTRAEEVGKVDKDGGAVAGTTDDAGSEFNMMVRYPLNPNVKLEATWAHRTNDDAAGVTDYFGRTIGKDESSDYAYLMVNVAF